MIASSSIIFISIKFERHVKAHFPYHIILHKLTAALYGREEQKDGFARRIFMSDSLQLCAYRISRFAPLLACRC
jgi:hypothetical protein